MSGKVYSTVFRVKGPSIAAVLATWRVEVSRRPLTLVSRLISRNDPEGVDSARTLPAKGSAEPPLK